jgi:dTDP-4-dehydrorhamnose reductase
MRLLLTGMSGFLGHALQGRLACAEDRATIEVIALWHERRPSGYHGPLVRVDLSDGRALRDALTMVRPQAVIHMAAVSQPNLCETDGGRTAEVNVDATATIARWCARHQRVMVFTSSDLVFDGTRPPYQETDLPTPLNAYARQKVAAESLIQTHHPGAVICRMPLMFGFGGPDARGFAHDMVTAIATQRPIRLFTDEYRTPVSTACAAKGLLAALRWPGGIYHLGGPERISRFEFGRRIAAHLNLGDAHLLPLSQAELPMAARRPADVSLESRKAFALGFAPEDVDTAIVRMLAAYGFVAGQREPGEC